MTTMTTTSDEEWASLPLFPATIPADDSTFLLDAINTSNNASIKCDNMFA